MSFIHPKAFLTFCALLVGLTGSGQAGNSGSALETQPFSIQDSVEGDWRSEANQARDPWRNPSETLAFFGLEPGMTVVEASPGRGWYTEIIAPYSHRNAGRFLAAGFPKDDERQYAKRSRQNFKDNFADRPDLYGPIEVTELSGKAGSVAPGGSADMILTFRNVHNWVPAGTADALFAEFFRALRPGGVLGVVDHRLPPGMTADPDLSTGYIHESTVIQIAENAGFVLEESSEINRNKADTADHPYGVWTLPPTALSAPFREAPDPDFDRAAYDTIGESDRFTLRFRKPGS